MLLVNDNAALSGGMPAGSAYSLSVGYRLIDTTSTWWLTPLMDTDMVVEVTDSSLIDRLKLLSNTIHTDGSVRTYGSGSEYLASPPLAGDDLAKFILAAKYIAKLNAARAADKRYKVMAASDTVFEQATWTQQLSEANDFVSTSTASTPLLTQLAAVRNITVAEYAQKVITANAGYTAAQNSLLVELKTEYQKIDDAATAQAVKDTGWL